MMSAKIWSRTLFGLLGIRRPRNRVEIPMVDRSIPVSLMGDFLNSDEARGTYEICTTFNAAGLPIFVTVFSCHRTAVAFKLRFA